VDSRGRSLIHVSTCYLRHLIIFNNK
jgi:hypothetical protein